MLALENEAALAPPPAYHWTQAWLKSAFHLDALTLVEDITCACALRFRWMPGASSLPASIGSRVQGERLSCCLRS